MTTPTKKATEPGSLEATFFMYVMKNLKNKPEVDWDGVAQAMGHKNGAVSRCRFGQIKKKLGWDDQNSSATPSGRVTKPRARKTSATKAKADKASSSKEPGVTEPLTPTANTSAAVNGQAKFMDEDDDDYEDDLKDLKAVFEAS